MMMFSCGAGRRKKGSPVVGLNFKGWKWDSLGMVAVESGRRTDWNDNLIMCCLDASEKPSHIDCSVMGGRQEYLSIIGVSAFMILHPPTVDGDEGGEGSTRVSEVS